MSAYSLNSIEKKAAVSLAAIFSFRMLGLFMLMPVFAIYGEDLRGFSPFWIGMAIGAYGLTQALLQIPMGLLSDRFGRKPIIIVGLLLFALGSVIAAVADSVYMITLGRVIQGMGAIASTVLALAADLTRDEQRPKVMAVIGMCIGLSFALALVLGPIFVEYLGLSGLFWITAGLAGMGILVVLYSVPTVVNKAPKGETIAIPTVLGQLIHHPQLLRLDIGVLLLHLMLTALFVSLPVVLVNLGISAVVHWQLYLPILMASFFLMVPLIIYGAKKAKERVVFLLAIALIMVSLLGLFLVSQHLVMTIGCVLLFFVAFNYLEASLPALVSRVTPVGNKGSAMGIYSSSQFFGAFLGGIMGGIVADQAQPQTVFLCLALLSCVWLWIAWGMTVPKRSKPYIMDVRCDNEDIARQMANQLVRLPGVIEVTVVCDENLAYLKIDDQLFDKSQAQQLVIS